MMKDSDNQIKDQNDNDSENDFVIVDYKDTKIELSKSCPNCTQLNKKKEGSLPVQCFRCNLEFCWFCLESLESSDQKLQNFAHFATCTGRKAMPVSEQIVNGIEFAMPNVVKDAWREIINYVKTR